MISSIWFFCWGVLMHIPDAERAISQLVRVTKPGGFIVLEEVNQSAPEALGMRLAWSVFKNNVSISKTPRGYEQTSRFAGENGFLATRECRLAGYAVCKSRLRSRAP